ncbi:MAG: flagellar export protein FliJ [Phenylobacterium sp.]|uniref:flagellar export protein FliJ n=1 Tax=Phenylobacterium sp. TaxID=1871053 RepID=UPI00271F4B7B|nr:flagellar export protein FliJ [Phenylobacterium sp.]MDO8902225.1 flagellar export protein FliJ [Phenylobacterium sp.]MDP2213062.1 flagellar export protein FliJ [Phenylobacterium sp.]
MSWAQSLVKLSTYEVEVLQKRMAEINQRRADLEMRLLMLEAEGEAEAQNAQANADAGWYHIGFLDGLRARRAAVFEQMKALALEEQGARDALNGAFEEQKKYEQVAEEIRLKRSRELARRDSAAMDEMGLRRAAAGR